jgi:hypothetical protein
LINTGNAIASRVPNITEWKSSSPIANTRTCVGIDCLGRSNLDKHYEKYCSTTYLIQLRFNEVESDRRGVKDGWYSINATGKLGNGRF